MQLNANKLREDFEFFSRDWKDTIDHNQFVYDTFGKEFERYDLLVKHEKAISQYNLGYGEKPFFYLWPLIVSQLQGDSKFLEIGVYKGSILALTQACAKELGTTLTSYGLTPLANVGDKYSKYTNSDFSYDISFLFYQLGMDTENVVIIQGLSTDEQVKEATRQQGPFDVVYVDGGHDYDTVVNDIEFTNSILKPGGLVVMDDASYLLNLGSDHKGFPGHPEVAYAIRDDLDKRENYKHLFAVGHNRVWQKTK